MTTPVAPPLTLSSIGHSTVLQHIGAGSTGPSQEPAEQPGMSIEAAEVPEPALAPAVRPELGGDGTSPAMPGVHDPGSAAADTSSLRPPVGTYPPHSARGTGPEQTFMTSLQPALAVSPQPGQPGAGSSLAAATSAMARLDASTQACATEAAGTQTDTTQPTFTNAPAPSLDRQRITVNKQRRPAPSDSSDEADSDADLALPPKYKAGGWKCVPRRAPARTAPARDPGR